MKLRLCWWLMGDVWFVYTKIQFVTNFYQNVARKIKDVGYLLKKILTSFGKERAKHVGYSFITFYFILKDVIS